MKKFKKIFYLVLIFIGIISLFSFQQLNVKADDEKQTFVDTVNGGDELTGPLPVYELLDDNIVTLKNDFSRNNVKELPYMVKINGGWYQDYDENDNPIGNKSINIGAMEVPAVINQNSEGLKYSVPDIKLDYFYDPSTSRLWSDYSDKEDKLYVYLSAFTPKVIHYVDSDTGKNLGDTENNTKEITIGSKGVEGKGRLMDFSNLVDDFDSKYQDSKSPYIFKKGFYNADSSTDELTVYVGKLKPINVSVMRNVTDATGKKYKSVESKYVIQPNDTLRSLTDDISGDGELGTVFPENADLKIKKYSISSKDEANISNTDISDASFRNREEIINYFSNLDNRLWNTPINDHSGGTIDFTYSYEYTNPQKYTYNVTIPSNLDSKLVPTVSASGEFGDNVTVTVPAVSGYTANKKTVTATVNRDGTITTNEKVTYTKKSSGSNHNNSDNPVVSNTEINIATNTQADVYNNSANILNETVDSNKTYKVTKKMTKDGQTYYQIADGKWIKVNDAYQYKKVVDYLRVYKGSYKRLYHSNDKLVTNRGLATETDWYVDQVAVINGEKYYRVATDEWVKADEGNLYQSDVTVINVNQGTKFYDEKNNVLGEFANNIALKVDRISNVNGQKMYRVATNEYVLASDVK